MRKFFLELLIFFAVLIILLELIFNFIVLAPEFPDRTLDKKFGVYKFKPNQSGTYTSGRLSKYRSKWVINQEGWNSSKEYKKDEQITPIIGDSFVQCIFFDPENHIHNIFQRIDQAHEYYSFGIQGASFSQTINTLKYLNFTFSIDTVILVIDAKDLRESVVSLTRMPRNLQLDISNTMIQEVNPVYFENPIRSFVKKFALFRYIYMNFNFERPTLGSPKVRKKVSLESEDKLKQIVANYVINELLQVNDDIHLVLVLDADRKKIYNFSEADYSKFYKYFKKFEGNSKITIVDLQKPLKEKYLIDGLPFEISNDDRHWNKETYQYIAKAVLEQINRF